MVNFCPHKYLIYVYNKLCDRCGNKYIPNFEKKFKKEKKNNNNDNWTLILIEMQ